MGGHGGLNILPQKRWNVYNFENREKVRKDEEAAAKEEQLKREESRKRDFELRLEQLRAARGLAPAIRATEGEPIGSGSGTKLKSESESESKSKSKSNHMNLFEGLKEFDVIRGAMEDSADAKTDESHKKKKKVKKEEATTRVVTAEDEKYRLGYGVAGKGVKLPWYLARPGDQGDGESARDGGGSSRLGKEGVKSVGKKTLQELREERVKREKREKERELALVREKSCGDRVGAPKRSREFSRR